jgi:transposase
VTVAFKMRVFLTGASGFNGSVLVPERRGGRADRHGLPIAVWTASGERHETKLVHDALAARFGEELPKKLVGDRAYDSDTLDAELRDSGVEMIAPHNPTRKTKTQDARALRRYRRRWHIERLFAWMMRFRRLVTRYERRARNFLAFAKLACIAIFLRQPAFRGTRRLGDTFPFNRLSDAF